MTVQKDQIQSLITDIDSVLQKTNARLWGLSGEVTSQRQVLERIRNFLVELQKQLLAQDKVGAPQRSAYSSSVSPSLDPMTQASSPIPPTYPSVGYADFSVEMEAHQVLQDVVREMGYLRASLLQPLQTELELLRRQRDELLQEIRQLETQRTQSLSTLATPASQQQMVAEFTQSLLARLQETLPQHLTQMIRAIAIQSPTEAITHQGTVPYAAQSVEHLQLFQTRLDQALISLDTTLNVVFTSLQHQINAYQDSLTRGLEKMHHLGRQGELQFTQLMEQQTQTSDQETSANLQISDEWVDAQMGLVDLPDQSVDQPVESAPTDEPASSLLTTADIPLAEAIAVFEEEALPESFHASEAAIIQEAVHLESFSDLDEIAFEAGTIPSTSPDPEARRVAEEAQPAPATEATASSDSPLFPYAGIELVTPPTTDDLVSFEPAVETGEFPSMETGEFPSIDAAIDSWLQSVQAATAVDVSDLDLKLADLDLTTLDMDEIDALLVDADVLSAELDHPLGEPKASVELSPAMEQPVEEPSSAPEPATTPENSPSPQSATAIQELSVATSDLIETHPSAPLMSESLLTGPLPTDLTDPTQLLTDPESLLTEEIQPFADPESRLAEKPQFFAEPEALLTEDPTLGWDLFSRPFHPPDFPTSWENLGTPEQSASPHDPSEVTDAIDTISSLTELLPETTAISAPETVATAEPDTSQTAPIAAAPAAPLPQPIEQEPTFSGQWQDETTVDHGQAGLSSLAEETPAALPASPAPFPVTSDDQPHDEFTGQQEPAEVQAAAEPCRPPIDPSQVKPAAVISLDNMADLFSEAPLTVSSTPIPPPVATPGKVPNQVIAGSMITQAVPVPTPVAVPVPPPSQAPDLGGPAAVQPSEPVETTLETVDITPASLSPDLVAQAVPGLPAPFLLEQQDDVLVEVLLDPNHQPTALPATASSFLSEGIPTGEGAAHFTMAEIDSVLVEVATGQGDHLAAKTQQTEATPQPETPAD